MLKNELGSEAILKGVIILIFQKALDELKYSRMYAQLCKRLSIDAQNFEYSEKNKKLDQETYRNSTFLKILIKVCRDKFENRSNDGCSAYPAPAANAPAQQNGTNNAQQYNQIDEDDRKFIVKQKMLGNVKFIGELFTLDMLETKTIHRYIQDLLPKSGLSQKERCENMECLSQIIRTCGKILDTEKVPSLNWL